jgi:hypothetical protein
VQTGRESKTWQNSRRAPEEAVKVEGQVWALRTFRHSAGLDNSLAGGQKRLGPEVSGPQPAILECVSGWMVFRGWRGASRGFFHECLEIVCR